MTYKVRVSNVTKSFDINRNKTRKLLSLLSFGLFKSSERFYALKNIDFQVKAGDSVGIIGLNGSGKTTLSDLLAGVTQPTIGSIDVKGKISLIAISAGLENELTGIENIRLKCLMHGMTQKMIDDRFEGIVEFSELGDFLKQPIKTYSSGMKSRLGFAIAINTNPDILIVDEALSVGDQTFANKCLEKIKDFQNQGKTIFFVSHAGGQIRKMCNKAVWIQFGEMKSFGSCEPILKEYESFIETFNMLTKEEQLEYREKMSFLQQKNDISIPKKVKQFSKINVTSGIILLLFFIFSVWYHTITVL